MYQFDLMHAVTGLVPTADRYDTNPQTDWISLENYNTIAFLLLIGAGATGTATITVQQAANASGGSAANIPFRYKRVADTAANDVPAAAVDATASGFTTTAGANQLYIIEVNAEELDADKPFVAMTLTEVVNSPVAAGVLALLGEARYKGDTPQTAIA